MKFKLILCLSVLCLWVSVNAQKGVPEPKWVRRTPISKSDQYYFRVTYGEGKDYDAAYIKAFAKAIYENSCKQGIYVDMASSKDDIERDITTKINVDERSMWLFINKVCEFYEVDASGGIHMYILWQIGNNGKIKPVFEPFDECDRFY